jgi:exodeoxyribonuclease-3
MPTLKLATWNVNGIRARESHVNEWLATEAPDVVCLQEIKATPAQVPASLLDHADYWSYWHGASGYSGVAMLVKKSLSPGCPSCVHPAFDFEQRIATVDIGGITIASVYVPNGGKDLDAKMRFLADLRGFAAECHAAGRALALCGDMNVAREDRDVHPKERKPTAIGQTPAERDVFAALLATGLTDAARTLAPDADDLFTWWAPWRNLRQRNIGWRIDYILTSGALDGRLVSSQSQREVGTSDHAPVLLTLG